MTLLTRTRLSHLHPAQPRHAAVTLLGRHSPPRFIHISSLLRVERKKDDSFVSDRSSETFPRDTLDQGHVVLRGRKHLKLDVQSEAAQSGFDARNSNHPYDAASTKRGTKAACASGGGNPELVGFAEQVGSQSATADAFAKRDGGSSAGTSRKNGSGIS